jgi:hypothetical protein
LNVINVEVASGYFNANARCETCVSTAMVLVLL